MLHIISTNYREAFDVSKNLVKGVPRTMVVVIGPGDFKGCLIGKSKFKENTDILFIGRGILSMKLTEEDIEALKINGYPIWS